MANGNAAGHKSSFGLGHVISLGIVAALGLFWVKYHQRPQSTLLGKPAPEFNFRWPDGRQGTLASLKGKTVLVNFWASWCGPCMAEMPSLHNLESRLEAEKLGFILLAVSLDDVASQASPDSKMPRNLIYDYNRQSVQQFPLEAVPVSVLIDPKGVVQNIFYGSRNWGDPGILSLIKTLSK